MIIRLLSLMTIGLLVLSCGAESPSATTDDTIPASTPETVADAYKQAATVQQNNKREVLTTDALKKMLPAKIMGLDRGEVTSNRVSAGGFDFAMASAEYRGEGSTRFTVSINDGVGGNLPGMDAVSFSGERGTTKSETIQVDGNKAMLEFDSADGDGKLVIFFPQTTILIEGRHLEDVKQLEQFYDKLSLSAI